MFTNAASFNVYKGDKVGNDRNFLNALNSTIKDLEEIYKELVSDIGGKGSKSSEYD